MRRLVLLPGLAADERMWARLGPLGLPLVTPRLPAPAEGEAMASYGARVARELAIGPDDLLGGCSFGALVAAEIARSQPVRGLVLVAGALTSATVSLFARSLGFLPRLLPVHLVRRLFASDLNLRLFFGAAELELYDLARAMMADTPDDLLVRGGRLAVTHRTKVPVPCPLFAIHGARDRVMAPPIVPLLRVVHDAGHGLPMSHPEKVTAFLREVIEELETK